MIRAVLFDLDETLLDRTTTFRGFVERQVSRFPHILGAISTAEYVECLVRLDHEGNADHRYTFRGVEAELSLPEGAAGRLLADFDAHFPDECIPFAGAARVLCELRDVGLRTGLITNGSSRRQRRKIELMKLEPLLDVITVSEEVGIRKPDGEIFRLTLERLAVSPEQSMYVGDNPEADVMGASAHGMVAVWKRSAFWAAPREADATVDSLEDVVSLATTQMEK